MDDPEKAALLKHLTGQRGHVLGILEGLDDEQLRRPVLPSGWSCLGLVRHLTLDDERFWFSAVAAGEPADVSFFEADPPSAWIVEGMPARAVLDAYRQEIERSNQVIHRLDLASEFAWWPDFFGDWRLENFRDLVLHVTTETSVHAGHLDAARELIDHRQWIVLDEGRTTG